MRTTTKTISYTTYQYTQVELRERINDFNRDIAQDYIQEAIAYLEDNEVTGAIDILKSLPTKTFDEMTINDITDDMYIPVLFPEPIDFHYQNFINKHGCKILEKNWLDNTFVEIVNYDGGEVLHRMKMRDLSW